MKRRILMTTMGWIWKIEGKLLYNNEKTKIGRELMDVVYMILDWAYWKLEKKLETA